MSETLAAKAASRADSNPLFVGDRMPDCRRCGHVHRFLVSEPDTVASPLSVIFDDICPCGCPANGDDYDGSWILHSVMEPLPDPDYEPDGLAIIDATNTGGEFARQQLTELHHDDEYSHDVCAIHQITRPCGLCDAGGVRGLDAGGDVRGGRLGRLFWRGLSRLVGDLGGQLVRERGRD